MESLIPNMEFKMLDDIVLFVTMVKSGSSG
jgi:hypothetical protein